MNLLKTLEKEMEKGNYYVTEKGELVNLDKLEEKLKKDYITGAKKGEIDVITVSFSNYFEECKKGLLEVEEIINLIKIEDEEIEDEEIEELEEAEENEEVEENIKKGFFR